MAPSKLPPILPLIAALCSPAALAEQDPQDSQARIAAAPLQEEGAQLIASDGKPAAAGRIPAETPREASEAWTRLVSAVGVVGRKAPEERSAPRSFDLHFDGKFRREEQGLQQLDVRLRYLEVGPGLVSAAILEDDGAVNNVNMRGLGKGDKPKSWYRKFRGKAVTDGWIELKGRDYKSDREFLDEFVAMSFNVARVTEPESCRLVGLRTRARGIETDLERGWLQLAGDPGFELPPHDLEGRREGRGKTIRELGGELSWLDVETPDIRVMPRGLSLSQRRTSDSEVKRVVFGLDPKSHQPQLMIISPARDGALMIPGTVLIQTTGWFELTDAAGRAGKIPGKMIVYQAVRNPGAPGGVSFDLTPAADLFMLGEGSLMADLTPDSFRPGD